jgi:hypothetical protein
MVKTIIMLPNGTELSSGAGTANAIQSVTVTECVNDSTELSPGSACANVLEAKILVSDENFSLNAGDEVTVYSENDKGQRESVGLFTMEKPVRSSANSISLTAYDRITWLDKDIAAWLMGLKEWPYALLDFAGMVCTQCGLTLVTTSIPNGDYMVPKFSAQSVTGRKLMQWVGQIAGRFCRATPEGNIEFAWYTSSGVNIAPDGDRFYYQNGLSYEDYSVAAIEKVQLKLTTDDVGVVWPTDTGEKNTLVITGNYLLTTSSTANLQPVAEALYEQVKGITYTPCKVTLPAGSGVRAGHTVQLTDRNGKTFTSYIMTRTRAGQRETLESTGSQRRDSTTAVNDESYRALSGQILEIKKNVEGFAVTAKKIEELEVGARNLIRNSTNLIYKDYTWQTTEE